MSVEDESEAVNSAIMAAADQILAGLKGGVLFSNAVATSSDIGPITHIDSDSFCEATANEVHKAKTDDARCSPTGVHQHEHSAAVKVTSTSHDNDVKCISHSSQVSFEEPNNDMTKIASASSLTSSELSHGDHAHGERVVEVPPLKQVAFASGYGVPPIGGVGTKRVLPPASEDASTGEPLLQKQRLENAVGGTLESGEIEAKSTSQAGGQGQPITTDSNRKNQREDAVPGIVAFQPIPPAPQLEPKQVSCQLQGATTDKAQRSSKDTIEADEGRGKDLDILVRKDQAPHGVQTTIPGQGHVMSVSSTLPKPAEEASPAPAAQVHKHQEEVPQDTPVSVPALQEDRNPQAGYPSQPTAAALSCPPKAYAPGQVACAPLAPRRQTPVQGRYFSHIQPSTTTHGYAGSTDHIPIAPAPTQAATVLYSQAQPTARSYVATHLPIAPAPPKAQESSLVPIAPAHPKACSQQQTLGQTSYQKSLPPICPRPAALDHQGSNAPHHPQQNPHSAQAKQTTHLFPFKNGMPSIPPASHIASSSIQLDHMNHNKQTHTTTQDSTATATVAASSSPNNHTHHQSPHASVNNETHRQSNTEATTALRCPVLPAPAAGCGSAGSAPAPATTGTPGTQTGSNVSTNLRNQRMQPTDCLLYAASLLQELPATAAPPASSDARSYPGQHRPIEAPAQPKFAACPTATVGTSMQVPVLPAGTQPPQNQPRDLDVLCGRGGLINKHVGNIIYRRVVEHNKPFYQSVQKRHRILVSQSIVHTILNRGGRFLSEDNRTTMNEDGTRSTVTVWKPVPTARAIQKTSQALRERVASEAKAKTGAVSGDSSVASEDKCQ